MELLTPHMPEAALAALDSRLRRSEVYLEFGMGGSTVLAARLGVPVIVSVDSSKEWVEKVAEQIGQISYSGKLQALHADIGPTVSWGYPKDTGQIAMWPTYYSRTWLLVRKAKLDPDLVLVDGRFRVACFLISLINLRPGATILWDDYRDRPEYHGVESLLRPVEMHDHMAEFVVDGKVDKASAVEQLFQMLYVLD